MTFDGIRVTHSALQDGAANMLRSVNDINERLDRLEQELELLRSSWSGSQQGAYLAAKTKWDTAIAEMVQLLNDTQRAVVASDESFVNADTQGARRFGG
jgi:6 kDa early secretory antigenic target